MIGNAKTVTLLDVIVRASVEPTAEVNEVVSVALIVEPSVEVSASGTVIVIEVLSVEMLVVMTKKGQPDEIETRLTTAGAVAENDATTDLRVRKPDAVHLHQRNENRHPT